MSPRLFAKPLPQDQRDALAVRQRALHAELVANPQRVAHPIVADFFRVLSTSAHSMNTVTTAVGMSRNTIRNWRHARDPKLTLFIYALNAIGYTLKIVPIEKDGAS